MARVARNFMKAARGEGYYKSFQHRTVAELASKMLDAGFTAEVSDG